MNRLAYRYTLITLAGPTCSGKSTLEQELVNDGIPRVISNTSRSPRNGEIDGVHYRFRSREWFDERRANGSLVEFVEFNGNCYGNTERDIFAALENEAGAAVWVIEPHGHKQVKTWNERTGAHYGIDLVSVFVNNPLPVLMQRFVLRELALKEAGMPSQIKRLEAMFGIEREWVSEAQDDVLAGQKLYDVYLSQLNQDNGQAALWMLKQIARCGRAIGLPKAA